MDEIHERKGLHKFLLPSIIWSNARDDIAAGGGGRRTLLMKQPRSTSYMENPLNFRRSRQMRECLASLTLMNGNDLTWFCKTPTFGVPFAPAKGRGSVEALERAACPQKAEGRKTTIARVDLHR